MTYIVGLLLFVFAVAVAGFLTQYLTNVVFDLDLSYWQGVALFVLGRLLLYVERGDLK